MQMILNKRFKLARNQKGMTLIELMAVVVILGILAAVAGAAVVNGFDKSRESADATSKSVLIDAAQRYFMENPPASSAATGTVTVADLITKGFLKAVPEVQSGDNKGKLYDSVVWTIATGNFDFTYANKP